jgi:Zn-dependent protease with chaperone function
MRWLMTILAALSTAWAGQAAGSEDAVDAGDIIAVLQRSHRLRLEAMPMAERHSPRAQRVRAGFDALVRCLPSAPPVELVVVKGQTLTETLHGNIIVANEALGDLPEGEILFFLAHEFGHVVLGHWPEMGLLYRRWVPGEVTPQHTDTVAGRLGSEASALAHRQEFEADAFGLRTLHALGLTEQDAVNGFVRLGVRGDTVTHPSTRKRVAALRAIVPQGAPASTLLATER